MGNKALVLAKVLLAIALPLNASATDITGAGSTFVYPILAKWADAYKKETGDSVNYQSIGSGGGMKQIQGKTVDFGASDMPMKPEELEKLGLVQFPIINGALVAIINVKGIASEELKLTGPLLAEIFMGKVTKWNDPKIAALNPKTKLPDQAITVIHRSDGSGTTFVFSNYLSKVSPDWKSGMGEGTALKWQVPGALGGKGNEGVANFVKQTDGSIGYVEFAYALQNKMAYTLVQNAAGEFVKPSSESFKAAAAGADWAKAPSYYLIMTNSAGKKSWPIAGSVFVLMHKEPTNPKNTHAALKFFKWAFNKGAGAAEELHYVPLPASVTKGIEKTWKEQIKGVDIAKPM